MYTSMHDCMITFNVLLLCLSIYVYSTSPARSQSPGMLIPSTAKPVSTLLVPPIRVLKEIGRELEALHVLQHPQIVALLGVFLSVDHSSTSSSNSSSNSGSSSIINEDDEFINNSNNNVNNNSTCNVGFGIALEYMNKGTLSSCLLDDRWQRNMSIDERLRLAMHVVCGIHHMHSSCYMHRDLTTSSVLLEYSRGQWFAKLSDFGSAVLVKERPPFDRNNNYVSSRSPTRTDSSFLSGSREKVSLLYY